MIRDQIDHCNRIYMGRIVHTRSLKELEIFPYAALFVLANGTIAHLEPETDGFERHTLSSDFEDAPRLHLQSSQFLFPGMIDTHLHAPQWPNLALGMEGELRDWLENYTDPMEASYSDVKKARKVYRDVVKTTLRLGSTTVAYNSTIHAEATNVLAQTCYDYGQRAIVGKMSITLGGTHGNFEADTETALADNLRSLRYIDELDPDGNLVRPCVMPRSGPFCPPDLMSGLGRQREQFDAYVQGHMCETHSDIDRALEVHTEFSCYSDLYKAYGLLNEKSIMAHCIHLTPKDIENLRDMRAGVAHNPNSNTCLRDGECRVRDLLDQGIKVGLGTDCSAGYMPSIHDAMRSASNVSRHLALKSGEDRYILGFSELMYLATMGGAQVVGREDEIGNFEVGKKFDALVVDVKDVVSVTEDMWEVGSERDEDLIKKWVFLGDDRTIRKVFVDGKLVAGHDL